jgi:hypothetical protein
MPKNPKDINAANEDPRDQAAHAGVHQGEEPTGECPVCPNSMGAEVGDYDPSKVKPK